MCEPTVIAGALGAGMSVAGQLRQGKYNQAVAENNATLARYQQSDALRRGETAAGRIEQQARSAAGSARAAAGSGGVGGASVDSQALQSMIGGAQDAATVRANAAREAWGYGVEAQQSVESGQQARQSGYLGALGSGLSGIGSVSRSLSVKKGR